MLLKKTVLVFDAARILANSSFVSINLIKYLIILTNYCIFIFVSFNKI